MNQFPERIEAGGLLLRPLRTTDLDTVERHLGDPEIARWMAAVRQPFGRRDAEMLLALSREPSHAIRVVERGGAMVGCLGLSPDVWFWLDHAARGQGVMQLALRAAIGAHFARPAPPLLAACRQDNAASRALLAGLGFARMPVPRRMFFAAEGRACACLDHLMTAEQWLMLHPPVLRCGTFSLRPALQKDAPTLMHLLPRAGEPEAGLWPEPEALGAFIETHRCRRPGRGLFVVQDAHRRVIGMALVDAEVSSCFTRFLTTEDAAGHASTVTEVLLRPEGA